MYNYEWDPETRGYLLVPFQSGFQNEVRPVFYEELELLGFSKYWKYPKTDLPLLWAEGVRRYVYNGEVVAVAQGGGFFSEPQIDFRVKDLSIEPVDIDRMVEKNKGIMSLLVQKALEFIYNTHLRYKRRNYDISYVAFSGGKDSLVLLDLVQRALSPDEFVVIFADTGMEIDSTYSAVKKAQEKWDKLRFYIAKSHYSPEETWKEFGPPSRIHRWCCSVHKTVPSLLKLREIVGKSNIRALVFDGVRAEESDSRANYSPISEGKKHFIQVNCSPLLEWSSVEIFLYIFERNLLFNLAYRYGLHRVGCSVCPMSSNWKDYLISKVYERDVDFMIDFLKDLTTYSKIPIDDVKNYIKDGNWKKRAGGRGLEKGGNRVIEQLDGNSIRFLIRESRTSIFEWLKPLGKTLKYSESEYEQEILGKYYKFSVDPRENGMIVEFKDIITRPNKELSLLKNTMNKVAYCIGCKNCMTECPTSALDVNIEHIFVDETKCKNCGKCIEIEKGCLLARSLQISGGKAMLVKISKNYQTFGLRKDWLDFYFNMRDDLWVSDKLGNRQFESLRVWLRDAGIMKDNKITPLAERLSKLGSNNSLTWAIIWSELAYNSPLIKWYVIYVNWGGRYTKKELIEMIGDGYSISTRDNAITSLIELFRHSPLGDKLGLGVLELKGRQVSNISKLGWKDPERIAILYSLYKYAEAEDRKYNLTLSELVDDDEKKGLNPIRLFGIDKSELKRIIQGLSIDYPDFVRVEFIKDLDNIFLNEDMKSLSVVDLALKEG